MDDFDLTLDLNLRTILITTDAALTELRAQSGSLLFTASTSGLTGSGLVLFIRWLSLVLLGLLEH